MMKKLPLLFMSSVVAALLISGCRFAKEEPLGDTIPANIFEPHEMATSPADSIVTDSSSTADSLHQTLNL